MIRIKNSERMCVCLERGRWRGNTLAQKVLNLIFTTFPKAPWKRILLNMLTVVELVKRFTTFMEPKGVHKNPPMVPRLSHMLPV